MDELLTYLITPAAQIALIVGIAEIVKRAGCPTKYIPIVDLILGIISGICVYGVMLGHTVPEGVLVGIAMGLSACGLFSGVKNVIETKEDENGTQGN